jgi:hypothetical protein
MCIKFKDCKYTAFVGNEHDIAQLGLFGMLEITGIGVFLLDCSTGIVWDYGDEEWY